MLSGYEWTALAVLKEEKNIVISRYPNNTSDEILTILAWLEKRILELEERKPE